MSDLITWLRAQLDDDERVAREAMADPTDDGKWASGTENWQAERIDGVGITIYDEGGHTAEQARHIARWDPARVLAEVDAKRRILDSFAASSEPLTARTAEKAVVRMVLKLLALPYADHPGYRDEWRPS